MAYELVKPEGEEGQENAGGVDPRDRKDWDTPPWARVGTEAWHKAWMEDADSGYLDSFHTLQTKLKHTREQYLYQKSQIPVRKEAMRKEKNSAAWHVLLFGFVIPVAMWLLTQLFLELGTQSGFSATAYLVSKIATFPVLILSIFFALPPSARDYVNSRYRYNVLNNPARHSKFRDEHHIVSFAEEEHFLKHKLDKMKEFDERVKREKLDQAAAGEDFVFLDEMSEKQKQTLAELEKLAEFEDCQARPGDTRINAGYAWIIVGFGIMMGVAVIVVVLAGIRLT